MAPTPSNNDLTTDQIRKVVDHPYFQKIPKPSWNIRSTNTGFKPEICKHRGADTRVCRVETAHLDPFGGMVSLPTYSCAIPKDV